MAYDPRPQHKADESPDEHPLDTPTDATTAHRLEVADRRACPPRERRAMRLLAAAGWAVDELAMTFQVSATTVYRELAVDRVLVDVAADDTSRGRYHRPHPDGDVPACDRSADGAFEPRTRTGAECYGLQPCGLCFDGEVPRDA